MLKDHDGGVPASRRSAANPGGVYAGNDALRQGGRRDKDDRKNVFADRPDCGRLETNVVYGFTPRPAIAYKHNGVRDEFHERRPQTGGPCKQYERGNVHELSDGDCLPRSEHHRVNHHERMPRRTREEAPKHGAFLQYERPIGQESRADIPR